MQNVVDEIKSRLDIVDIISEYIQLKPAGTSFKANCPFHREKLPSFFVSPEKQIWHCFGCGKGSDLFGFIQEMEGIEFPEALRILANRAGVKIEKQNRHLISQKTKLLDICSLSSKFYHKILIESPLAKEAREYLNQRKLNKKIIAEFELGFVPEKWDALLKFLIKRKYKESDIELAGLIIKKQTHKSGSTHYDRFRNRIIFPIYDLYSQIVGFTGRILPGSEGEENLAKYINTPETPIYSKGRILYGMDKARSEIKHKDSVVLVEGNMDVLAAHQIGDRNVVCTSGTALTNQQIKILKRYTENIILAFDVDLAGQTATQRSIDLLLQEGINIKVLKLEKGKDPDECIRENPKIWKKALKNPLHIMEYYFSIALKNKDLNNINDKKEITRFFLPIIAKLGDSVEQGLWLKKLSNELNISEIFLYDAIRKIKLPKIYQQEPDELKRTKISQERQAIERFLGLILQNPEIGEGFLDQLILDMFSEAHAQSIVRIMIHLHNKNRKISLKKIQKNIESAKILTYLDGLIFLVEKEFKNYSPEDIKIELNRLFTLLKKRYLNKKMEKLVDSLKQAEIQKNKEKIEEITQRVIRLSREISK